VASAGTQLIAALRDGNLAYEERFGFVFLVCATGKSAAEMLALLTERLTHDRSSELQIAAAEHTKITRIRLEGLATA
jgi:2-oxo-4-hydroxy-4-carboxy-5-ureidoimidazoline decarboxylase